MRDVKVRISGENAVGKVFQQVGSDADRMGQRVEQNAERGAASMKKWEEAGRAVGAGIGALVLLSNKAAGDAEASNARLAQSFDNVGLSVDDFSARLDNLGDSANRLAFDDEDLQDALSELITVTKDADAAFRDLALAEDISRARKISIEAATRIVIAAETERFGQLSRLGIAIDANATKEEALAQLQAQYAGQAEAYAGTTAASWERLGNTIENKLESIGGALDSLTVPLLALSAAGPVITTVGGSLSGLIGGGAGLTALATSLAGVGAASAAIAAPLGIATYLFLDQKNVVADATRVTLENQKALEGYITYLKSINLPTDQFVAMSQEMKALFDWATKTSAGGFEALIDPNVNVIGDEFVATLGDMSDELLRLNPENLQAVQLLMKQLGVDVTNPATWDPTNIATLINYIYTLSKAQDDASYEALELNRAQSGANVVILDGAAAAKDAAESLRLLETEMNGVGLAAGEGKVKVGGLGAEVQHRTTDFSELTVAIGDAGGALAAFGQAGEVELARWAKQVDAVTSAFNALGAGDFAENALAAFTGNVSITVGLDTRAAQSQMEAIFRIGAGNLQNIAKTSSGIQDWADDLVNVQGEYGEIDKSLEKGLISQERYNMAQRAYNRMAEDNARIQDLTTAIQAKQVPLIAQAVDYQADQLAVINNMSGAQQTAALGFMDTAESAKFMALQTQLAAAASGELGDKGRDSMQAILEGAIAADPYLKSMLEQMNIITTTDGEVKINWDQVAAADGGIGALTTSVNNLVEILADIFDIKINHSSADDASAILSSVAAQMAALDGKTATVYINRREVGFTPDVGADPSGATGGVIRFATGGIARLAELGPELLRYPSGAIGMAMRDGFYAIPNGTHVSTAAATESTVGNDGREFHFHGPVYITPPDGDAHDAFNNWAISQGTR